jgi:hypothetical protein
MDEQYSASWWIEGKLCETCGIWYCSRHSPYQTERAEPRLQGPLGTTGLDSVRHGSIDILFLDNHFSDLGERTQVGQAVYRGKSYDGRPGSQHHAEILAEAAAMWLKKYFTSIHVTRPNAVVAVPAKPERRGVALPAIMAGAIAESIGVPVSSPLRWLPGTAQVKGLPHNERRGYLAERLDIVGTVPSGTILLVDDILQTGTTIAAVARKLKEHGAAQVVAFAPSRALRGGSAAF